ncbi:nuclear body protein SP140 [Ictalurus punctatus]|uniref:Nuclear body protein SP140 n=1 Tax=Ictalurus punctatus TaxID=7998 RepID=A0A2D0S2Y4_ICTPU|nr:nuclear body protein SP140 [Ictalurus punctatus]
MDPLDFLTHEEMIRFLRCKKTEISSYIEEPRTFLNQLRDHDLVPENLYQKVKKMKNKERKQEGVYEILDWVENKREQHVGLFWRCMFRDHLLQKYPIFRLLRNSLLDGSYRISENLPKADDPSSNTEAERKEKKQQQKKGATKRKKSGEETDEEERGPSSVSSKKKPAMKPTLSQLLEKGELPVTCGDKEGTLYKDKLARGEMCILSDGVWFTPCDFERFSGRGNSKNWKLTIRCQNITLYKFIQEGNLQCPRTYRDYGRKGVRFSSSCVESSSSSASSQSASSVVTDESSEDHEEWTENEDSEQEEEEEDSDTVDLSEFQDFALPVSCGSVSGLIYKDRFTGSRSKSIRTEERWFTPEEFVKQELTLTDGHWKKDILCHGKTLNYLVKKKILYIHSLQCPCRLCCPENRLDQDNDDVCYICNSVGNLVCCDECPRAFHHHCHLPTLQEDTLGDNWMCTCCVLKNNHRLWLHMSREGALSSPVSGNMMRCEYLLLQLYKADRQRVFTSDPTKRVERYSSVISKPMWLNRVKTKLQKDKYRTVRQFVRDIKLIFTNCQTFNKVNKYGRMGAKMKKEFEKEFNSIFKIQ